MRRKRLLLLAMFVGIALVASACGQQEDAGEEGEATERPTAACTADIQAVALRGVGVAGAFEPLRVLPQAKKTVKIGFVGDLTGKNSALVIHSKNGAQLAIEQANAAGDLPVTIQFAPQDNKDGGPDPAPALAQKLISDPAVMGVIGPAFSGETKATGKLFADAGLTHVSPSATNPELTKNGWKTFFRGLASDEVQGGQTGELMVKALGCDKIGVVNDKSEYGVGIADAVKASVKKAGGEVVVDEGIEPTTDYTPVIDTLIAKRPEAIYYAGYSPEGSLVVRQYREKAGTAVMVFGDGSKDQTFLDKGKPANEKAIVTCPCLDPNASTDAASKKFAADYKAKYGQEAGVYSAEGWDVAQIFVDAIRKSGADPTREKILEAVTNLKDFKGLSKTFNWTSIHEVEEGDITYVYRVKAGRYELLGRIDQLAG